MSNPKRIVVNKKSHTCAEWAEIIGVKVGVIHYWLRSGEPYTAAEIRSHLNKDEPINMDSVRDVANAAAAAGMTYGKYVDYLQRNQKPHRGK